MNSVLMVAGAIIAGVGYTCAALAAIFLLIAWAVGGRPSGAVHELKLQGLVGMAMLGLGVVLLIIGKQLGGWVDV